MLPPRVVELPCYSLVLPTAYISDSVTSIQYLALNDVEVEMGWCAEEFSHANFGDLRLKKRFLSLSQSFLDHPGHSIPAACRGWAGSKAAYRFFDNEKVTLTKYFLDCSALSFRLQNLVLT